MRISIAMATYNGERFIREQLDSLARQTYLPSELVVTDDGSTDRTLDIIEDFAKAAPFPIRIVRNEKRLGYADNFLKAASLCKGDWIAFCDQDDVWLAHKLEIVSNYFEVFLDIYLITHSAALVDEDLTPLKKHFPHHPKTKVFDRLKGRFWYTLYGFTAIFRRELIQSIPWQRRPMDFTDITDSHKMQSHDLWIYFLASSLGKVALLNDVLALYRRHKTSVTGNCYGSKIARIKVVFHTGRSHYQFLAGIAREYEEFLLGLADAPQIDIVYRERFLQASKFMEKLSLLTNNRAVIHGQDVTFFCRARVYIANIKIQMKTASGDFTAKTFIKDILGVFRLCKFNKGE